MQNAFKCQYISVIVVSLHDMYIPCNFAQNLFCVEVQRNYFNSKGL